MQQVGPLKGLRDDGEYVGIRRGVLERLEALEHTVDTLLADAQRKNDEIIGLKREIGMQRRREERERIRLPGNVSMSEIRGEKPARTEAPE